MTALFSGESNCGDDYYKVEVFDKSLVVSKGKKHWLININVGQVKNLFVEGMALVNAVFIFVFGTEKMAVYKISVEGNKITRFDIPPLVENRVVYSILSQYKGWRHNETVGQYITFIGGVKYNGEASDAMDVYKFSENGVEHIASGRLLTPAERPDVSICYLHPYDWYNIGDEKWALDLTPQQTTFKRLNDQDIANRREQDRAYEEAQRRRLERENEENRRQWHGKEWPVYTGPKECLPDVCGMCLCEAEEIKVWTLPPCGHVSHAACVNCMRLYKNRYQCHVCRGHQE